MKQAKRTIICLAALLIVSVAGFIISMETIEDNSALLTVIFRTVMAGSLVGLITGMINYYSVKERILQDFSNDLLTSHTEFYNFRKDIKEAVDRIENRGYYFDTREFSVWMQALTSASNETKGTLIVPYKFDPFIKKGTNGKIIQYMNKYIRADRRLWYLIDDTKYQMMEARIAIEENHTYEKERQKGDISKEEDAGLKEHIAQNNKEVDKLVEMLKQTGAESHKFKEFVLEINRFLSQSTTVSPVLEIEASERKEYKEMMEKAESKHK